MHLSPLFPLISTPRILGAWDARWKATGLAGRRTRSNHDWGRGAEGGEEGGEFFASGGKHRALP